MPEYDLVVIGSGAAGTTAAKTAVRLGVKKVAIVEQGPLWGTCINVGCVPSKFLLTAGDYHYYKNRGHNGVAVDSRFNLYLALAEKEALIERLRQKKYDKVFNQLGIILIEGSAEFATPQELKVDKTRITAARFIIATGSTPSIPPVKGITSVPFMTNVEGLTPDRIPESLIVIGGRALGLEFAQMYAHFGTRVTLLQRSSRIIPEEEPEIADLVAGYLREEGLDIRTGVEIRKAGKSEWGVMVTAVIAGKEETFSAEHLMIATGRSPNTQTLHLERAGVTTSMNGAIVVDSMLQTTAPGIWAAGDVTGEPMLETVARYGGEIAAANAFSDLKRSFDRSYIPRGIFTTPQIASIGLTEEQARRAGMQPIARSIAMERMAKTYIMGDTRGMVKIVAEKNTGFVLGVHVCSALATEIIGVGTLAVTHHLTVEDLATCFPIFPNTGEAISVCARTFRGDGGKG